MEHAGVFSTVPDIYVLPWFSARVLQERSFKHVVPTWSLVERVTRDYRLNGGV